MGQFQAAVGMGAVMPQGKLVQMVTQGCKDQTLHVWMLPKHAQDAAVGKEEEKEEYEEVPVSMGQWIDAPPSARIARVYTPPVHRGRGYASHLTAHLTAKLLKSGRSDVVIAADAANKTVLAVVASTAHVRAE